MATGPYSLFEYDKEKIDAAIARIDELLANGGDSELPSGEALEVGKKPPKKPFVKHDYYVQIRLLDMPLLSKFDRAVVKRVYEAAGWAKATVRASMDHLHTVVELFAY